MSYRIVKGDVVKVVSSLFVDEYFDACLCDPPYLLQFMGKEFDKQHKKMDGTNEGQKMQAWHERWTREVLRVLKPGAHMLAFGGTRTYHRLASAVENVGFEIRDTIEWVYGSGFPKSTDISKQIDKRGGYPHLAKRIGNAIRQARESRGLTVGYCDKRFCGGTTNWTWFEGRPKGQRAPTPETFSRISREWPELEDLRLLVDEAEREITGQSMHKPGIANRVEGHYTVGGTQAKHIDITAPSSDSACLWSGYGTALKPAHEPLILSMKPCQGTFAENALKRQVAGLSIDRSRVGGRWPANFILSHHPDCVETDRTRTIKGATSGYNFDRSVSSNPSKIATNIKSGVHYGNETVSVWECHPDCPVRMLNEQSGILHGHGSKRHHGSDKGTADRPQTGGESGGASRFFYCAKVSPRERNLGGIDCRHPTLKPISLTTYLARLLLPPARPKPPRRLLVPFSGAGSEIIGALFAGWDEIWGIEQDPEYIADAEARIAARHTLNLKGDK